MRASTRLAIGAVVLSWMSIALIVALGSTEDAAVAGPSIAGYGTWTNTPTPTVNPCAAASEVSVQCTTSTPTQTPSPTFTPTPFPSLTPCPTVSPTNFDIAPQPPVGDADCDHRVDIDDVRDVLLNVAGLSEVVCEFYANAKCDDDLDPVDALLILEHLALIDPQLPAWCRPFG